MVENKKPLRVAMWSGPRNVSTALMRSWENRGDTFVCDEPFYAHYLSQVPVNHPGREQIIATQENDWRKVVARLTGPVPENKAIFYQKHMAHHLLDKMDRSWFPLLSHVFLIREPAHMLRSLGAVISDFNLQDTGLPQSCEIFDYIDQHTNTTPVVIDAKDLLNNPSSVLKQLCDQLGIPFDEAMLSWPAGKRDTDGIWAPHWYASVEASTGFKPYVPKSPGVPAVWADLLEACMPYYAKLYAHRITP